MIRVFVLRQIITDNLHLILVVKYSLYFQGIVGLKK